MIVSSNDWRIWIDTVPVPNVKTVSLALNISTIEVTTKPTNGFRETLVDTRNATVSFDALLDQDDLNRFNVGDQVVFRFGTEVQSFTARGSYISSIEQSGGTDDAPVYSVSVESTGEIVNHIVQILSELCDGDGNIICYGDGTAICLTIEES